ncbi:MAG: DUF1330 domain-containing protein, partial [Chromatocurvus sp.]
ARSVPAIVSQYGGEYIVMGGDQEPLEGDWSGSRVVLHRWPDMATARVFWSSPEYTAAKKLREGTGQFRVILVEGRDQQVLES